MRNYAVVALLIVATEGCSLSLWNKNTESDSDAGDAATSNGQICAKADATRVCFASENTTSVPWGLTSISAKGARSPGTLPSIFVAAHGASQIVELEPNALSLDPVSTVKMDVAPWQVVQTDYDLDSTNDIAVASPGTLTRAGEVSFWRYVSSHWEKAASQRVGLGTYAVATRGTTIAEEVLAVAASYGSQSILPIIAHRGAVPTGGNSIALDLKPTALLFGVGPGQDKRVYVVGDGATHGMLLEFEVAGTSMTKISKSPEFGRSLNDLKLGDLNGDSVCDAVAIEDSDVSTLYSVIADKSQGWTIANQLQLPAYSHAGVLVDFDQDGRLDVATISGSTNTIQICFGTGRGGFGQCILLPHGLKQPTDIASIDLNSDKCNELVVVGYEGRVSVFRVQAVAE